MNQEKKLTNTDKLNDCYDNILDSLLDLTNEMSEVTLDMHSKEELKLYTESTYQLSSSLNQLNNIRLNNKIEQKISRCNLCGKQNVELSEDTGICIVCQGYL